jgi:hypothetical protein
MQSTVSSAIKSPSIYLWVVLQRRRQRNNLNIFTLEIFAQDNRRNNSYNYKLKFERHTDQSYLNWKIIGYGSLDHNKVVQRTEEQHSPILLRIIASRSEFPSCHDGIRH